jgi:hypothetical protein
MPAGFCMAVRRSLSFRNKTYRAAYGTMLSVKREHQLQDVAQGLVASLFKASREVLEAELFMGSFDQVSAGKPVVEQTIMGQDGTSLVCWPEVPFWACTYDLTTMHNFEPLQGLSRLALLPAFRRYIEARRSDEDLLYSSIISKDVPMLSDTIAGPRMRPDADFLAHYPCPPDKDGGTLVFRFSEREQCACSYHIVKLCKPGLPDHRLGHIQIFRRGTASFLNLLRALKHVRMLLLQAGCLGAIYHDNGTLPRAVLLSARFVPTPRHFSFVLCGRKDRVEPFLQAQLPFEIDVL